MRTQAALKVEVITDKDIGAILSMREAVDGLKKRLKLLEGSLDAHEANVISKLNSDALNQSGYELSLRVSERRYPAWKEQFIAIAGVEAANHILESTKPTLSTTLLVK